MLAAVGSNIDYLVQHFAAGRRLALCLLRNQADAEDVVQEAFLRALRYWRGGHPGEAQAWILAIVRNVSYDWIRRSRKVSLTDRMDTERVHADIPSPEGILLAKLKAESIRTSLDRLPPNQRRVVILRDLEGMPYKEIAERAEIPVGTVMSRLARGRANLRVLLATHH